MADGIAITPGVGTTVATDDAGAAGHVQIQKLAISTDGSATLIPADATYGLDVDVTRIAAGTNYIGKTRVTDGTTDATVVNTAGTHDGLAVALIDSTGAALTFTPPIELSAAPSIGTTAMVQYDSLHTTVGEFTTAALSANGGGTILGARLVCKHDTFSGKVRMYLFSRSVTGTTQADPLSISDTDMAFCVGTLLFDLSMSNGAVSRIANADRSLLPLPYFCTNSGTSLFYIMQLWSADTPTFGAGDLVPSFITQRD
jgi:hypothetical protein